MICFKEPKLEGQFEGAPLLLRMMAEDFCKFSKDHFGITPVITRITDPVKGESGVHLDYRALDIRDEHDGKFTFTTQQRNDLLFFLNEKYARNDKIPSCIWHSFGGGPHHFHLQIATLTKTYMP